MFLEAKRRKCFKTKRLVNWVKQPPRDEVGRGLNLVTCKFVVALKDQFHLPSLEPSLSREGRERKERLLLDVFKAEVLFFFLNP